MRRLSGMFTTLLIKVLFKATMRIFIKEGQLNNFGKKKNKKNNQERWDDGECRNLKALLVV